MDDETQPRLHRQCGEGGILFRHQNRITGYNNLLFPRLGLRCCEEVQAGRRAGKWGLSLSFCRSQSTYRQRNRDESMNKQATEMAGRIQRAVKSGKLTVDGS